MIQKLEFSARRQNGEPLPAAYAYKLYGWLMEQLPPDMGDALHEDGCRPIGQYLRYEKSKQGMVWAVSLLDDGVQKAVGNVLTGLSKIELHDTTILLEKLSEKSMSGPAELAAQGRSCQSRRTKIWLQSPCAFKQNGRYAIYPQETLILHSLLSRWNSLFPECPLQDSDAEQAILQGLHIIDYNLRTQRYPLKGSWVPGCQGSITLEARLALPLQELWNTLLALAPYCGLGVKTALGMGGTELDRA